MTASSSVFEEKRNWPRPQSQWARHKNHCEGLQLFVLLTASLVRGRAVAKEISTRSSIPWVGWISEALRGDLSAITLAFSALCRNRANDFILQCFWPCIFLEQEINTKMESSLPLTWQ